MTKDLSQETPATDGAGVRPTDLRPVGLNILNTGGAVASRAELLDYIAELRSVTSAIEHGLAQAAWRGQIEEGASLDDFPLLSGVEKELSLRSGIDNAQSPGESAFAAGIGNAIRSARDLGELLSTAWTAGLAEDLRVQVDDARTRRARDEAKTQKELLEAVVEVVRTTVPEESRSEVAEELRRAFQVVSQRSKDAAEERRAAGSEAAARLGYRS